MAFTYRRGSFDVHFGGDTITGDVIDFTPAEFLLDPVAIPGRHFDDWDFGKINSATHTIATRSHVKELFQPHKETELEVVEFTSTKDAVNTAASAITKHKMEYEVSGMRNAPLEVTAATNTNREDKPIRVTHRTITHLELYPDSSTGWDVDLNDPVKFQWNGVDQIPPDPTG